MSCAEALVLVGQTAKPIDVLFSSGAGTSSIGDSVAADLGLTVSTNDTTSSMESPSGERASCTKTAQVELLLGNFRHVVSVSVMPGSNLAYLVLGIDWLIRYHIQIDFAGHTIEVTDDEGAKHTIQMRDTNSGSVILPSVRVVSRTANSQDTKREPFSRNRMVEEGWGNRVRFQASYGLTMSPEDIKKGNRILKVLENWSG